MQNIPIITAPTLLFTTLASCIIAFSTSSYRYLKPYTFIVTNRSSSQTPLATASVLGGDDVNVVFELWRLQYLARNSRLVRKIVIEIIVTLLKSRI